MSLHVTLYTSARWEGERDALIPPDALKCQESNLGGSWTGRAWAAAPSVSLPRRRRTRLNSIVRGVIDVMRIESGDNVGRQKKTANWIISDTWPVAPIGPGVWSSRDCGTCRPLRLLLPPPWSRSCLAGWAGSVWGSRHSLHQGQRCRPPANDKEKANWDLWDTVYDCYNKWHSYTRCVCVCVCVCGFNQCSTWTRVLSIWPQLMSCAWIVF